MSDTSVATEPVTGAPASTPAEKPAKEKKVKEPPVPPTPVAAVTTPLADRDISDKKKEKLVEALNACIADFDALRSGSTAPKGVAILAGRGALPHERPEGYQGLSLAQDVIKGRRVSGTLFSSRLKNLLIEKYSPMQYGPWLIFAK